MLKCEGYIMFKGVMKINETDYVDGIWLYKPECECWYCAGKSYPKSSCEIIIDNTK